MNEDNKFNYEYQGLTDKERQEIERIKESYTPNSSAEKLKRLRQINNKTENIPLIVSLTLGICGTLVFGLGLTCILEWDKMVIGIIISVLGFIPMGLAYPVNNLIKKKLKEKYKEEIIKLSDELLEN